MATHSSTLAWKIPWTEEPGGLLSLGSHRVRHDWSDLAAAAAASDPKVMSLYLESKFFFILLSTFSSNSRGVQSGSFSFRWGGAFEPLSGLWIWINWSFDIYEGVSAGEKRLCLGDRKGSIFLVLCWLDYRVNYLIANFRKTKNSVTVMK